MIEVLVSKIFSTRNAVHLAHWKTKSYAQHVALGDLYDHLIEDIDAVVEMYQGMFGLIKVDELPALVAPVDIVKHLAAEVVWITDNQKDICKGISAISNQVDNLTGNYMTTLFKLKQLS